MTAETLQYPLAAASPERSRTWISSALFDSIFFLGSPLVIMPMVIAALAIDRRFAILFFFLAFPHYASTFAFFFWDEYETRHRARWFAFFAGPFLIFAAFGACLYFAIPGIIQIVLFVWNMWHVARQSGGILSIYRHRAGVFDPAQRNATNYAILSSNLFLAFWNIETHPEFAPFLLDISPVLPLLVKTSLGVIAAACLVRLGVAITRRVRAGQPLLTSEVAFLVTSIVIFHPFLWMQNSAVATAVMLLPHYVQYLGLVWLLHRRRFRTAEGSPLQRALTKVSSSTPLLLCVLFSIGFATVASYLVLKRGGAEETFEALYLLLAFEHFYLDGLFWAFRDPSVRKSIAPFLTGFGTPTRTTT